MHTIDHAHRLHTAAQAVQAGGQLALSHFGTIQIQVKSDGSELTQADLAIDDLIRTEIERVFDEPVISEETIEQWDRARLAALDTFWLLDPIDGTTNFANGLDWWGPILCFRRQGVVELAVATVPRMNLTITAVRGQGTRINDQRVQVAPPALPLTRRDIIGGTSFLHRKYTVDLPCKIRIQGSQLDGAVHVANGSYSGALIGGINAWERWAVTLMIQEAGGIVEPIDRDEILECGTSLTESIFCQQAIILGSSKKVVEALRNNIAARPVTR